MAGRYHIIIDGQKRGPFSKQELETQGLHRDTLVWCKGLPDWTAAGRVPDLLDVFDEPPPLPGEPPLAALPARLPVPSEQIKDPAVSIAPSDTASPPYADASDQLPLPLPRAPWRIPYDAVGMRRLYLGGMAAYVPGLVLVLLAGLSIAWLGIHGIAMQTPRFDARQRSIVFDFDPAARSLQTLAGVTTAGAMLLGVIGLLIGAICFLVLLHRAWCIVYDGRRGPSPGQAVGFLFIPFFNVYWVYVALWGLARRLNRMVRRHDLDAPPASQPLSLALSVYSALTYVPFPFAGLVPLGMNLILCPFFMRSIYRTTAAICEDANRERIAQSLSERSLRHPDLPRPFSAHLLSTAALVLAPLGVALFVIGFGVYLHALRHYDRDIPMSAAQRQAIDHLRGLNPPAVDLARRFEDQLNRTEGLLMRWRENMIISGAVLLGGVLLLALTIGLAQVSRLCARAGEDAAPPAPSAWPAAHGAGF